MDKLETIQTDIIQHSFLAVLLIDQIAQHLSFVYTNEAIQDIFSQENNPVSYIKTTLLHPEDIEDVKVAFSKEKQHEVLQHQEDIYCQFRCKKSEEDVSYTWMEAHGMLFPTHVLITIRNISKQQKIAVKQRRMEYYRLIALGNSFSQLYEIDLVNNRFQSILNRVQDSTHIEEILTDKEIFDKVIACIHEDYYEEWKKHLDVSYLIMKFHQGEHLITFEYRNIIRNETFWMRATFLYAKRYENEEKAILMINDITTQRRSQELTIQTEMLEKQIQVQLQHYKHQETLAQDVRNFRHDMKNHLLVLESLHDEHNDQEFKSYIETMRGYLKATTVNIQTGNTILDALLNEKVAYAQKEGIHIQQDIQIQAPVKMESLDVCVVFGNAFDNAIEACLPLAFTKRHISFTLLARHQGIILKIVNACDEEKMHSCTPFKTNKKDTYLHGLGIQHMKQVIESYNGIMDLYVKDDCVHFEATLYHKDGMK